MPGQLDVMSKEIAPDLGLQTLPAIYDHAVEHYDSRVAMKSYYPWGYQSTTYQELGRLISYLGSGLIASGLEPRKPVALIADNCPEWAIVYAAVTSCGSMVVPLDNRLKENEIRHLLLHSEANFLVTSPRIFNDSIESMNLKGIGVIVMGEVESARGAVPLGDIMAIGREKINSGEGDFFQRKAEVRPDDVAAICYTSGTTGDPKGSVLLHSNIASNIAAIRSRIPLSQEDVFLCLLPLHHTFATTCNLLTPLSTGCSIVFGRSMKQRDIRNDIEREGVTILVGVPLLFEHMVASLKKSVGEAPKLKRFVFSTLSKVTSGLGHIFKKNLGRTVFKNQLAASGLGSIRFCISGAAPLRHDVEEILFSFGLPILEGYGLTETSPVVSVNPLHKPKRGTVGLALPGIEVEIDSPGEDGIGEILVRGPNVMREYYKNPEATGSVLRRGWLYTGDLGRKDTEGYITIAGRKKSVIVTAGGKNVYPDELELLLSESPIILESLVLPVRDRKGNDRIGAIIVPDYNALGSSEKLEGSLTEEGIKNTISTEIERICSNLADYKRIVDFQIRDQELPKTTTRKVKRHLVKWIEE